MESRRFDLLTRRLSVAASRRQAFAALVAGAIAPLFWRMEENEVAAKCKGYKSKCKKKSSCCDGIGLRCQKDRCKCKKGWKRCSSSGKGCTRVKADSDNCGSCGNECPPATPCCINGSCQAMCGGSCCADCYMDFLNGVTPQVGTETCCGPGSGTFCSSQKGEADDECCWPDQECVNGECCADGKLGSVVCGGECCAETSCCNGECCPEGQVCGMTTEGLACVSANRECDNDADCLADEDCHDGVCCSGNRICGDGMGNDVCCSSGEWCDDGLGGDNISCCAINTQCHSTWRGHRSRR